MYPKSVQKSLYITHCSQNLIFFDKIDQVLKVFFCYSIIVFSSKTIRIGYKLHESIQFVVSELVVGSFEQDTTHKLFKEMHVCFYSKFSSC